MLRANKKVLLPWKVTGQKQNVYLINYITLIMKVKGDDLLFIFQGLNYKFSATVNEIFYGFVEIEEIGK